MEYVAIISSLLDAVECNRKESTRVYDRFINSTLKGHKQLSSDSSASGRTWVEFCICIGQPPFPVYRKYNTLTMVFLTQQVLCGWKEHLHELWNLPDDMNCTQCCLSMETQDN